MSLAPRTDTLAAQLRRRRVASRRMEPLDCCRCRDPWPCRCHAPIRPMTEHQLDGWVSAARHLDELDLLPLVPVGVRDAVRDALSAHGGSDRALARRLHAACPERAA